MYIHIGGNITLPKKNIIAIFDLDNTTTSKWTRQFLKYAEENGLVKNVSEELPRTFIVADNGFKSNYKIYISPISAATLLKRAAEDGLGE